LNYRGLLRIIAARRIPASGTTWCIIRVVNRQTPFNYWPGVLLVLIAAFALRLWQLNATSLWYDETFMLYHAQQGVGGAVLGLLREDNALPLHGLLLALWIGLAGSGEFAARYLSVLLGTLAVALVWRLGGALAGRRPLGWGPALACAALPIQVYYAQEVRMYALTVPLAAAFAWMAWRLARTGRGTRTYILLGTLMLAAHLYAGLLWAVVLIAHSNVYFLPQRRAPWLRANLWLALTAAPIVAWALWRARTDATGVSAIPLEALRWLPVQFGVGQYLSQPWAGLFLLVLAISCLAALGGLWRTQRRTGAGWLLVGWLAPVALMLALSLIKAKWSERYLLPSLGLALTVGAGLGWSLLAQKRVWRGALLALAWLALALPAIDRQATGTTALGIVDEWHPRPDFRSVARYIAAHSTPDDAIVVVGGYAAHTLAYYYDGPAHSFGLPYDTRLLNVNYPVDLHALYVLEHETGMAQRLWLVLWQDHLADPTALVQSVLLEQCARQPVTTTFTNVSVLLFDVSTCRPLDNLADPPHPLHTPFAEPVHLAGYELQREGETWVVGLWWETTGLMPDSYIVSAHLVTPDGELVAQHDRIAGDDRYPLGRWAAGTRLRNRFFLTVPGGECVDCTLRVGLYNERKHLPLANGTDAIYIPLP